MNKLLRIAFVGSCQVAGLKASTQLFLPDADVQAYHVDVSHTVDEIREQIAGFDTVVTQMDGSTTGGLLSVEDLEQVADQAVFLPIFAFTGLHPDMTYITINGQMVHGPGADVHSILAASGFILGLDEQKVQRLFNAHIFSELGYFDAYEAAKQLMSETARGAGYDYDSGFDDWSRSGKSFMHTANHPAISVLSHLARDVLVRAGHVAPEASIPDGIEDHLALSFVAPVLPSLARRLKIEGGTTYLRSVFAEGPREVSLREYIGQSFDIYRSTDMSAVYFPRMVDVLAVLKRVLNA